MVNAGSRIVNNWIYPIDKGYVLIDTGYENGFAHLKKKLRKINIDLQQMKDICLKFFLKMFIILAACV